MKTCRPIVGALLLLIGLLGWSQPLLGASVPLDNAPALVVAGVGDYAIAGSITQQHLDHSYHDEHQYDCLHHTSAYTTSSYSTATTLASDQPAFSGHTLPASLARLYDHDYDDDAFCVFTECFLAPGSGLPRGITYEGTVHRAVNPKYADSAFDFHAPSNLAANHRYTGVGRGGIYSGTSKEAVLGELAHYGIDPKKVAWVSKRVKLDNVLDLTNPAVRKQLGVNLADIAGDSYHIPQSIADLVRTRGYNGILFPSARKVGATNLVEFVNHVQ